jgi:hypothetical protein
MSARADLKAACATGDELTVRRLGWWQVYEALRDWWPKKGFDSTAFGSHVELLGDEDSDAVYEALRSLGVSKFRPVPSEILRPLRELAVASASPRESGMERQARKNHQVRRLLAEGTDPCWCSGIPHPPVRQVDGLWFCGACGGLDPATAQTAIEELLPAQPSVDALRTTGEAMRGLLARVDSTTTETTS